MQNIIDRRRLCGGIVLVVVLLGVASIFAIRRPILRAAGWALVVNDRVEPADVIVVTVEADGAGVLEAADLVHSGVATRVAVFGEPPDTMVEREFIRRGVPYENAAARSVRNLASSDFMNGFAKHANRSAGPNKFRNQGKDVVSKPRALMRGS
jgi:hypothetical protein